MKLAKVAVCCFLLLIYTTFNISKADTIGTSVLERSKHCVQAAREAYGLLQKEADDATTSEVTAHLEALTEDGKYLQKSAEGFLSKLESQEEDLTKTLLRLQKDKEQLEAEIEASKQEKVSKEGTYSAKESILKDNEKQLQKARKEKQDGEGELYRAKKKLKKKKKGLLGFAKSVLNKLVGHVSSAEKRVKRAKQNLARRESELKSAQTAASAAKQALSAIQSKINQLEAKIKTVQQQADKKHQEIGTVKNSIMLLRKSVNFWELFVVAAQNAQERTAALKGVVDQAAEKKDYELLREDGTITRAKSFFEAWEVIATDHRIQ